ncbi:hypothetical protein ACE1SV_72550 [Streptomyces sp. E-15]
MSGELVERLVPEDLWHLFQQVAPPAPVRPQGGGRRRYGDREVLAAIVFVALADCSWNQLPPGFGLSGVTAFRRFSEWSEARVWDRLWVLVQQDTGLENEHWCRSAVGSVSGRVARSGTRQETVPGGPRSEP